MRARMPVYELCEHSPWVGGWDEDLNQLEVEGQAENDISEYVEETDEEDMVMYEDEETNRIMESVFGESSDDEINT